MDTLTLKSIQLKGSHGVYESERKKETRFELDVTAHGDFSVAARTKNPDEIFNYELVESVAVRVMEGPSEYLIETLCKRIGDELFQKAPAIHSMEVALRKLRPPLKINVEYAEIRMRWQR